MKKILLILLVGLFQNFIFGATITSTGTGGNWNAGASWVGGIVPTSADDVVIASGATITVDGSRSAKTIDIRGILLFNANNTSINLPTNGTIRIVSPGKVDNIGCTNNMEINIGGVKYAACQGNGNSPYTFSTLNQSGGNCPTTAGTLSGNQYICAYGSKTTTFSSTVPGGTWSSSNTAVATVNASSGLITSIDNSSGVVTITYTVGGTGGCTQYTATRTVYVANGQAGSLGQISYNGTPYPNSPSPPLVLCKGSTSLTFSIPGIPNVSGYIWKGDSSWIITPSADGLSAVVTFPSNANQNNIEVYAKNGCTDFGRQSYIYITLSGPSNTAPTITSQPSTATQTTCLNGTVSSLSVTASGFSSYTYQWYSNTTSSNSGGTLIAGATSQSYTPLTTTAGTLYYYCVVGGACSPTVNSAVSGQIKVNAVPTATAGGPDNLCRSASPAAITLTGASVGGSATTGAWSISSGGGVLSSTLQTATPATVTYTPAANYTGTVTLVLTSNAGTGCTAVTSNRTINVNATPTLTITNPTPVCSPGTVDLTASAVTAGSTSGLTYTYWTNAGATTAYGTPTAATAGTYYIKGTNAAGCFAISPVTVTVNATPTVIITNPTPVCSPSTVDLTASAVTAGSTSGLTYTYWTNAGATTAYGTPTAATAGTYYIKGTTAAGCFAISPVTVTVNATPTVTITNPTPVCSPSTVDLTASAVTAGSTSGLTYTYWTNAGATTAYGTPTAATAGTYYIKGTTAAGCFSISPVTVTVNPTPTVTITNPTPVCSPSTVDLTAAAITAGSTAGLTYTYWTNAGATTAYGTPTVATAGTYYIKGTTAAGCFAISPVTVTVNANLTASVSIAASPTGTICSGTSVTFTATATNSGTTPVYQWKVNGVDAGTNSSTFTSTTLSNGDVVRVIMTSNASPCLTGSPATSNAVTMAVNPRPTPTFTTPALAQTCAGPHMTYTTQQGQSNYVWTVSGVRDTDYIIRGQGTSTDNYIVIEWLTAGSKTVTVNYNNSNGCNGAAAVYATNVTVIDRGQVNGGRENLCKSDPLPTLTLHSIAGNAVPYTVDPSLVVKWQYNDDINNSAATWFDIPDPQNVMNNVTYTPQAFPGAFRTYRVLLQNGSCTEESIESRIRILAFNAPTLGTTTYPTCSVSTGSVVLNNLPSGNWTINQIGTVAAAYTNVVPNTTSYTITGLATGSYTFTVSEGSCTSDASLTLNMSQAVNTWDGTKWSKTGDTTLPVADDKIVFEGNYTLSTNLTGCSCTVNTGNVVVNSGITLTITNAVIVNGGTLTFENNASLMQTTNAVNSGAIIYKRTSFPMKNFDATYWSSPVVGQTLVGLSPNTLSDKYIAYYDSAWKTEARTNVMKPGIGYAIRVPKPNYWPIPTAPTYAQPVEFKGVPNNGNITSSQAVTAGKYYLIGNPYPSALDAREFLYSNANNNAVLNGTIYFWTHNTGISPSGGKYVYSSNDYASFNATGGTATTGANNAIPSGYIAAGQSFMASAKANGTVQFDNSMRVGGADNAQFFKPGKSSKSAGFESHRLWLNMTNSEGAFKQTLIGYVEGATNSYDVNFDGETFDGNTYIDFYSVNTTNKLTIQGRALPFTNTDLVPLGYRSTIAGDFTISIDKADGNLATQRVYLEDKQTGTVNELTAGNYVFTTKAGTFNDRFVLRYSANTLGTGDFEVADDAVWVKIANKTVSVNSTSENIDKVFIYDLSGKQLYVKEDVNNLQLLIENLPFAQQVLLVKVVLDNGYQTTKKVVFN